ncbi:MAG: anti-sigma factor family protein [Acidimicrobiales bacterium]
MAPRTISCRDVGLRLQTYLDGELDAQRMEQISAHLDACIDCGLEADVFRRIKEQIAAESISTDPTIIERLRDFSRRLSRDTEAY